MTDNRKPRIWARVPHDEATQYQRIADRHYDGNLSLFVRRAVRDLAAYHDDDDRRAAMHAARMTAHELASAR